jgi:hypothetical protein
MLSSKCSNQGRFYRAPPGVDGDVTTWDHNYFCVLLLCIFNFDLTLIILIQKVMNKPVLQGPDSSGLLLVEYPSSSVPDNNNNKTLCFCPQMRKCSNACSVGSVRRS